MRVVDLRTRRFVFQAPTERDAVYKFESLGLDLDKTAIVLIDVWNHHPVESYLKRALVNIRQKIFPLLNLARKHNMNIIHCPHEHPIHKSCKPLPDEKVFYTGDLLNSYLGSIGVRTLLYAGYALNWCVFHRPEGIISMRHAGGYRIILLRDCTVGFETPESLDGEWALKMAINMVEFQWGCTSTLEDLRVALGET